MSWKHKLSNSPRLLITGASGFVGRHAVAMGRERFDVIASGRGARPPWLPHDVTWQSVDLLDRSSISTLPDHTPYVLHLASETVPSKFSTLDPLLDSVEMTLNLCRHLKSGKLLFASSCLVYASSAQKLDEDSPIEPRGHYGLAKQLCEAIVLRATHLDGLIARPFNHIGPNMRPELAIPSIIRRVFSADQGDTIEMSGINSFRDFLDVSDIVEGYFTLLLSPDLDDKIFNVCSGKSSSIRSVVVAVSQILGRSIASVAFTEDGNSADDTNTVVGDNSRLRKATGWYPKSDLDKSLRKVIMDMKLQHGLNTSKPD